MGVENHWGGGAAILPHNFRVWLGVGSVLVSDPSISP